MDDLTRVWQFSWYLQASKKVTRGVAGHQGLVGSAILRALEKRKFKNIVTRTRKELDLTNQSAVINFFKKEKPTYVLLAAAKVGGIYANNTYPAEFIYENIMIEANVIHSAYKTDVKRLLFLGSTCIYPREVKQPMREDALLTGVGGCVRCQAFYRIGSILSRLTTPAFSLEIHPTWQPRHALLFADENSPAPQWSHKDWPSF